jgi:hypothetical protein
MQTKKDELMASVRDMISARSSGTPGQPQTAELVIALFFFISWLDLSARGRQQCLGHNVFPTLGFG